MDTKKKGLGKFKPIRPQRVSDVAFKKLKEAIVSGYFNAGDRLPSERELAADFECSRMSIREAIRALELYGFVAIRQGVKGGVFVKDLNFDQLDGAFVDLFLANKLSIPELHAIRLLIEPEVARLAAKNIDKSIADRLQKAIDDENLSHATLAEDIKKRTKIHHILAEVCGNRFLEAILKSVLKLNKKIVLEVNPDNWDVHPYGSHYDIVKYVKAGDEDAAKEAMIQHTLQFGKQLLKMEKAYRKNTAQFT